MGKITRIGPVALTTTLTTNVYNQSSALIYDKLKQISITNKTASAATVSLWLGATAANAAGTEVINGESIPPHTSRSWPFANLRIASTDFLVGGSDTATALTLTAITEQDVV